METSTPKAPGRRYPRVLTIAGSEPLGSAGVQADIKAISACGSYAAGAITCIVDEDTTHVKSVYPLPVALVAGQISSFLDDVGADAIKIGFLPTAPMIEAVAQTLKRCQARNIVLDPVMVTSSGELIVELQAIEALKTHLFPLARIITPNTREAALLLDSTPIKNWEKSCLQLAQAGCSVVLKSVPVSEQQLQDLFYNTATEQMTVFTKEQIQTRNVNGTGCSFSSAIAAFLAQGFDLSEAVRQAEKYIHEAIRSGAGRQFGAGFGPVDHFYTSKRYTTETFEKK